MQIGNKTIILEKENDPTQLRSPSAGKLISYLVEDGGRVQAGVPYAEIEVMKMIMTLSAAESGRSVGSCECRPDAMRDSGSRIRNVRVRC